VRVVATAGHVDHGKSSLVLALTGTDPDRFAEEKARGLTIDLGFAFTTLPSGCDVGFVDVPGHERFVKNMLAGVGAIDVALFVVAAGDGWMPQSEEHLRILDLLGVRHGMVAVTKADTVAPDLLEVTRLEIDDHLATSSLRDAPVVVCDSVSGRGLDDVRRTLDQVLADAGAPADHGRPRLWVDRVFAPRGAGTVVTGTLTGGAVAVDDTLHVVPLDQAVRVRGIESAHRSLERVEPGARVALNLGGVDHHQLGRGHALVREDEWCEATSVDVRVEPIPGAPGRLPTRLRAAVGSGEHAVRVRLLDEDAGFARVRFDTAVPLAVGDRFVLRDPARARTIAGAQVLDVESALPAAAAPAALTLDPIPRLLASHGWLSRPELARFLDRDTQEVDELVDDALTLDAVVAVATWLAPPGDLARLRADAQRAVDTHHDTAPLSPGIELATLASQLGHPPGHVRAALDGVDTLAVRQGVVVDPARATRRADTDAGRALVAQLDANPFSPPAPADPDLARALVREGVLVDIDGIVFTADAIDTARARLREALADGGSITVSDARELLSSSRKYVVPLLEHLDRDGFTRRRGDSRGAEALSCG
jgi:selenocysteine-specific elongation factor